MSIEVDRAKTEPTPVLDGTPAIRVPAHVRPDGPAAAALPPITEHVVETAADRVDRLAKQAQNRRARYTARMPDDYHEARLDKVDPAVLRDVEAWLGQLRGGDARRTLILKGDVGVGKTYAAAAIGHLMVVRTTAAFTTAADYVDACLPDGDRAHADYCREAALLIFDDLAYERDTETSRERVADLINYRIHSQHRRQVISTNEGTGVLVARYGDRLVSRLGHACQVTRIVGEDRRGYGALA